MRLICLNTWAGTHFIPLMDFIRDHSEDTDIFCFQEILNTKDTVKERDGLRNNLYDEFKSLLVNFQSYYYPSSRGHNVEGLVDYDIEWGLATFVKKYISVEDLGDAEIYLHKFDSPEEDLRKSPSNIQAVKMDLNGGVLLIFNLHGLWWPGEKLDDENRLEQSKKILGFINKFEGEKIVCGDFNLMPETESIKMLERTGLRNLIKEFNIGDTRGPVNATKHGGTTNQKYSDYVFVSGGIKLHDLTVPKVAISDHLPMILDFKL